MAFPVVAARSTGSSGLNVFATSHPITLPAGIQIGDTLLVVFGFDVAGTPPALAADPALSGPDWALLAQTTATGDHTSGLFYKRATGNDALVVSTQAVSDESEHVVLRITAGGTPVVTSTVGTSSNTNPPALTPQGGLRDYLWIASRVGENDVTATAAPANYTNLTTMTGSTTGTTVQTAERSLAASAEDPGAFTVAAGAWVAWTIAVPPASLFTGTDTGTLVDTSSVGHSDIDSGAVSEVSDVVKRTLADLDAVADVVIEPLALTTAKLGTLPATDVVIEAMPFAVAKLATIATALIVVEAPGMFGGNTSMRPSDAIFEVLPFTVSYVGQRGTGAAKTLPPVRFTPVGRFIAQNILTGEFLSWELPVTDPTITWRGSGATEITGSFTPEIVDLRDLGLEPWGTWIHYEESDEIRASAILRPTSIGPDGTWSLTASGSSHYAGKVPYVSTYRGIGVDPADIVRHLWAHIQGFPRGNLGLVVTGSTPVRVGEPERDVAFTTSEGEQVAFTAGPFKLDGFEETLCGREIDELAKETPFDYRERSKWRDATRTAIDHYIDIGYPRLGRRLVNEVFRQGENLTEYAPPLEPDDVYADSVYFHGKGEGGSAIAAYSGVNVVNRLRLPAVVEDKTVDTISRGKARADDELAARLAALVEIPEIVVDTDHPNARLGTFGPLDEAYVELVNVPYVGSIAAWHRITGMTYHPLTNRAVVTLTRRDQFMQGARMTTPLLPTPAEARLIRELAEIRAQIDTLRAGSRATQLSHSTLYGALPIRDSDGTIRQVIGQQPDGRFGLGSMNGPPPDRPSTPIVTGSMNGIVIEWNGQLVAGTPSDLSHVIVYVSGVGAGFIPGDTNRVGTLSRAGKMPVGPLDAGTSYWVKFRAASTSKAADGTPILGVESFAAEGIPGQVVAASVLAGIIDELALAAGAVTAAKIAANAVDGTKIAPDSISSPHVIAGAIQALHVAADAITAGKIAADAITARELRALSVVAAHINANSINAGHIQAGVISADKLAALLVVASRVVVGNPTGARLELASAGLEQYDDSGTRTMRLGDDPASGNYLTIVDPLNTQRALASLTDEGVMTAASFIATDLTYGGNDLGGLLDKKPRGLVGWGQLTGSGTFTTTELGAMELEVITTPGRMYRVQSSPVYIDTAVAGAQGEMHLRYTVNGARPTISSPVLAISGRATGFGEPIGLWGMIPGSSVTSNRLRLLLSVASIAGSSLKWQAGGVDNGLIISVEDIGADRLQTGVTSTGGGTGTAAPTRKETVWGCTWSRSFNAAGVRFTNTEMVQGYYNDGVNGDQRSSFGFDDANIRATLSGATIHDVGLFLYSQHWYYNSGGYARIRSHNSAVSSVYPGVSGSRWVVKMGKPQGLWISLGAAVGNEFRDNATKGFALDATDVARNLVDYGRFNGQNMAQKPLLSIDYTK